MRRASTARNHFNLLAPRGPGNKFLARADELGVRDLT